MSHDLYAFSRLRKAVSIARGALPPHLAARPADTSRIYHLRLLGKKIGKIKLLRSSQDEGFQSSGWSIDKKYRGMGLGKKFKGEVIKRLPGAKLTSDYQVSDSAKRVWESMRTKKGYKLKGPRGKPSRAQWRMSPDDSEYAKGMIKGTSSLKPQYSVTMPYFKKPWNRAAQAKRDSRAK